MKLVTNKSKNLLYRIVNEVNTTVQFGTSYAIATQQTADTKALVFTIQGRSTTDIVGLTTVYEVSLGKLTTTFTTPSSTGYYYIRFGLDGSQRNTMCNCPIDLKPSTTYTFTCNFTNITQGSISWKDMMLVEGSEAGDYEPYSYNLLDKYKFGESNSNYINNGDGSITTTGTVFSFQRLFMDFDSEESSSISKENSIAYLTYGHKLLINNNSNSTGTDRSNAAGYIWEINSSSANAGSSYGGKGEIFTNNKLALADIKWSYFYMTNNSGETVTCAPVLYDLTLMYGAGKEPTTVDQFYTDYPELKVSPLGFIGLKNIEINNKNIKRLRYATTTRNLFDINKFGTYTSFSISIDGNTLLNTIPSGDTSDTFAFICTVSVKKNTNYVISIQDHSYDIISCYVYTDKVFGNRLTYGGFPLKFNSGDNESLVIGFYSIGSRRQSGVATWIQGPQIEEGSTATSYVPYGYLNLGITPSNSGYILDKYNNFSEELLEENIEKDNINYHIPNKTNISLNKVEGKTNKIVQLIDKTVFVTSGTKVGLTFTCDRNTGSITVNGTSTASSYWNPSGDLPLINNHKYLICGNYVGSGISELGLLNQRISDKGSGAIGAVVTSAESPRSTWGIVWNSGITFNNVTIYPQVFDLTAMYGFGNEPTTVEQFKKDYPQFFDEKLDGIWNVKTSGISTTGENIYGLEDFIKKNNASDMIITYDGKKCFKISRAFNPIYYFPLGNYSLNFKAYSTYERSFCSFGKYENGTHTIKYYVGGSTSGTWENDHYNLTDCNFIQWYNEVPSDKVLYVDIDSFSLSAGIDDTNSYTYQENKIDLLSIQTLNGINGVNDYIEVIDKGNGLYDLKKTQKIDSVDLGTLDWAADGANFYSSSISSVIKPPTNDNSVGNYTCQKYVNVALSKSFVDGDFGVNSSGRIYFRNSAYTTAAAFKTAMNGVILYYQLKTPVITTIATNLTYNQVSAIRTNGGLLLVNDNNNQKYVQPDVTLKENFQYKS